MIKRTLYFGNPAYLSARLEQLVVASPGTDEKKTIPIEDIAVVILDHQQITVTQALIAKLLNNNAAFITCNEKHYPTGMLLNLDGHTLQSKRFNAQIGASEPLKKQLWKQTIQAKILNQAIRLKEKGLEIQNMLHWVKEVKSGDAKNHEGRASAWYWRNIFKKKDVNFIRDPSGLPPNNVLNYAYAILRAITARSLVGSGMLLTLGIFHSNQYNAYCLADDVMEPYRPIVDKVVLDLVSELGFDIELNPEIKKTILRIPVMDVVIDNMKSPLMIAMQRTTASLAKCFAGESRKILYPTIAYYEIRST